MVIVFAGRRPSELQLVGFPVNVDRQVEDPGRRDRPCRNLDRVDPERLSPKDPLKRSELLVDDGVEVVEVRVLAARPTAVA